MKMDRILVREVVWTIKSSRWCWRLDAPRTDGRQARFGDDHTYRVAAPLYVMKVEIN
jgi:hypothetical protein